MASLPKWHVYVDGKLHQTVEDSKINDVFDTNETRELQRTHQVQVALDVKESGPWKVSHHNFVLNTVD